DASHKISQVMKRVATGFRIAVSAHKCGDPVVTIRTPLCPYPEPADRGGGWQPRRHDDGGEHRDAIVVAAISEPLKIPLDRGNSVQLGRAMRTQPSSFGCCECPVRMNVVNIEGVVLRLHVKW